MRLARRHDAELRRRRIDDDTVHSIRARKRDRGIELVALETEFLIVGQVRPADVEPSGRHVERGLHDADFFARERYRLRRVGGLLNDLEADPTAAEARQREAQQTEIHELLHVGGVQHRHHGIDEAVLALLRQRRGLAGVIVAGGDDHTAVLRRARRVAVLERIAGAIDARALAVPQSEHTVVKSARKQIDLLRAPDRRRREILVEPRLKADVRGIEERPCAPQLAIEPAERRAAVAGDEACRVPARARVAVALHEQQSHERLQPGQVQRVRFESVALV